MTENLLQKLEEKMLFLVSELEGAREEIEHLMQENTVLKTEKDRHAKKLHDLVSLLDVVNHEKAPEATPTLTHAKPVLLANDTVVG